MHYEQRLKPLEVYTQQHNELCVAKTVYGNVGRSRKWVVITILVLLDILLVLLSWEGALVLRDILGLEPLTDVAVAAIMPSTIAWVVIRALLSLYPGYGMDWPEQLRRHTYAVLATVATTAVFALALQVGDLLSRLQLSIGFLSLLLLAPPLHYLTKLWMHKAGWWGKPVIILGSGEAAAYFPHLLRQEWQLGYNPAAIFNFNFIPPEEQLPGSITYEQGLIDTSYIARRQGVDTVIFAMPHTRREQVAQIITWASRNFQHVLVIPNLSGITNSAIVARDLVGTFAVEIKYNLLDPWALRIKRAVDIVVTMIGGALILPLLLLVTLVVYVSCGGCVFYKAQRIGQDGKLFSCIKFQTMVPDAEHLLEKILEENSEYKEEYFRYHKLRNDPRITRLGRLLRNTSVDELPQLWNVLRGEMSLVGPRPYLPRESQRVGEAQKEILRVPPGITGPWQVSGRNAASFDERVRIDTYYIRDWSIWLDFVILARTLKNMVLREGAY